MIGTSAPGPEGAAEPPVEADERPVAGVDQETALETLLAEVAERLPPARSPLVAALARAAYRRFPLGQLRALDAAMVAAAFDDAYRFVDARRPGDAALRVYDPSVDEHGWESTGTVVEVSAEDSPFLLSTVDEELARLGVDRVEVVHSVFGVERGEDGRIIAVVPARGASRREAWQRLELAGRLDAERCAEVAASLRRVLGDALAATRDFAAMAARLEEVIGRTQAEATARYDGATVEETCALLRWLLDDHFILLGFREYDLGEGVVRVRPGSGLGILADESRSTYADPVPLSAIEPELRERIVGGDLLTVARTNRRSTVHRRTQMVYVGVKRVDDAGGIVGEQRLLGLFAQRAHAEPASAIPVLRRKLQGILEAEDIVDHSYDERALRALFEAFPKHELFAADVDALRRTLVALLEAQQRRDVRLLTRRDPARGVVSALVAMPRERFNGAVRHRVQALLAQWAHATRVDYHLSLTERDQALLHFVLHRDSDAGDPGTAARDPGTIPELERSIAEAARSWDDELGEALVAAHGPAEGRRLAAAWGGRFPPGYADANPAREAVSDIAELAALEEDGVRLKLRPPDARGLVRFKLYKAGRGAELSSFLPILESLGFTVVEEVPHRVEGDRPLVLHDFGVRLDGGPELDVARDGNRISAAATAVWAGRAEADSLNQLVLTAGLGWDDVALLRAYRRYRRQVGTAFTEEYQNAALLSYPDVSRALIGLFDARFDPAGAGRDPDAARRAVLDALDPVERLDQDRILRGYLGLVDATLRTNRYLPGRDDGRALALKLDSARVPDVPRPVPHVEVFVYSPKVEGVHLRGGPVARGGIRFSDRQEDVRTEVLGLMKAQMMKNALIVPTGAKGGFVLKAPVATGAGPRLRTRSTAAVDEDAVRTAYATYVRALLDITDNVVTAEDGRSAVVVPAGVRRADGDDPYLVVAPDRGTARLSDLANAISDEYGFWLGDAFASGGTRGYDHKAMGITARGAWAAVRRHFRELDVDVQSEPVTVAGIGDMSGDVFGNAMLQSRSCRLVAAFDHRHIFLDPDPDPAVAYAERQRLAALPRTTWADYERSRLSPGGGVWSRTVKSIPLSEPARALLRVEEDALSPPELIRAILRAPVDLLFAGGIGTFVKASTERHSEVGDRANDAVRVDAGELGARVVGEGANLALTQRARIQYARRGGRCNTDSIDNAAGVATSDREVNLKILLRHVRGLDVSERDEVLASAEADVARMVLADVEAQTAVLSRELAASPTSVDAYEALMSELERGEGAARLEREVEALPDTDEMARRREAGAGMTRPELAVLLGYAKVDLAERLLASTLPDEPALAAPLRGYFPPVVVRRFDDALDRHRLRRELIATLLANNLVNRMGITYASRTAGEFGAALPAVAAAYWVAREVAAAEEQWKAVEAADVEPALQQAVNQEFGRLVDAYTRTYLHEWEGGDLAAAVARDRPAFEELEKSIWELGPPRRRQARDARAERLVDDGVDAELAERVVGVGELAFVPDVAAVARSSGQPVRAIADVFLRLSEALPLERLHELLQSIEPAGAWQRWQQRGLADDLRELRRGAAARAVGDHPGLLGEETVTRYLEDRPVDRGRVDALVRRLEARPEEAGLAGVAVAVRALRELLAS